MKVVILAGGYGTRLSEYTESIPKPMVKIGDIPIIMHIMNIYASYGFKDFCIALGYKGNIIKEFFINYSRNSKDFQIDLGSGEINFLNKKTNLDWKVTLIDTGQDSLTGRRVKLLKPYLNGERFFLTYGDGLSNINLHTLLEFHKNHGKLFTMTAVRPPARFGELSINSNFDVNSFKEKPQLNQGWINGGFFVVESDFLDLITERNVMLEREPLEELTNTNNLKAFKHEGFWQCMDTIRDKKLLETLYEQGAPWIINQ